MIDMNEYKLGQTNHIIHVERIEENRRAALAIAQQSVRTLHIVSHDLDPLIYDNTDFINAVRTVAVSGRRAKITMLINDSRKIITQGHRLIELARHLSSFIEIRKTTPGLRETNEAYIIGDETALLYRQFGKCYDGFANFNDKRKCRQTLNNFKGVWGKSQPDPELRRLYI